MGRGFSGELLVALCGGVLLLNSFGAAYGMAVLFPRLHRELGVPLWQLAACFSCAGALYFTAGLVSGALADRFGTRPVVRTGALLMAAGLSAASFMRDGYEFEFWYVVSIGLGVGFVYVPVTSAVQSLCTQNSTMAAGIASAGVGLGACLMPPVANYILQVAGWQMVLQCFAGCAVAASFAASSFSEVDRGERRATRRLVLGGQFWVLYAAQTLTSIVVFVPFAHIATWATVQRGLSMAAAVFLISIIGAGSVLGRLALGVLGSWLGEIRLGSLCSALIATSLAGLNLFEDLSELAALLFVFGAAYGSFNALIGPLVMKVCGNNNIGQSLGVLATSRAVGVLLGPLIVGAAFSWLGQYEWPFAACSTLAAIATGLMLLLQRSFRVVKAVSQNIQPLSTHVTRVVDVLSHPEADARNDLRPPECQPHG